MAGRGSLGGIERGALRLAAVLVQTGVLVAGPTELARGRERQVQPEAGQ